MEIGQSHLRLHKFVKVEPSTVFFSSTPNESLKEKGGGEVKGTFGWPRSNSEDTVVKSWKKEW